MLSLLSFFLYVTFFLSLFSLVSLFSSLFLARSALPPPGAKLAPHTSPQTLTQSLRGLGGDLRHFQPERAHTCHLAPERPSEALTERSTPTPHTGRQRAPASAAPNTRTTSTPHT
uniref:Uncharacterized protein n=1 Tax=Phage sp. ctesc4 TaxID=2828008 RepID=A0A8S5TDJ9_9VIRU|nr:MAG TPA: hypothetical protein [Phage sp. ctesc4]